MDDLKKRLEKSESALDFLLNTVKGYFASQPTGSGMENSIGFAEEALGQFYVERVAAERDAVIAIVTKNKED